MITKKIVSDTCKHLAKCGMRSVQWCHKNRHTCEECKDCILIHLQSKCTKVENGIILRKCSICGQYLPLSRFYKMRCKVKDGYTYRYHCRCKFCLSDIHRQKQINKEYKK